MNFVSYDFLFPSFEFVLEFWVCFELSIHTPQCLTPAPRFFVSEFWVCSRVLGSFRKFHTHTTMLNARPTIFSFGVLDLFRTFHTHTPRCLTPAPRFSLLKFWVCYRVLGLFRTFHIHRDA